MRNYWNDMEMEIKMNEFIISSLKGFYPYFAIPALIIVIYRVRKTLWTRSESLLLLFVILHLVFEALQILIGARTLYMSRRYLLPCAPLLFGWCAWGIAEFHHHLKSLQYSRYRVAFNIILFILTVILLIDGLMPTVKSYTSSEKSHKRKIVETLTPLLREDYKGYGRIDGARESVDLIALHEYDLDSRWIHGTLAGKLREWDKPFAVLEFSFTNHRRGFACGSSTVVKTEADRGTAFRIYTEKMAADPLCVGTGYFILYDQPVTSRGHDAEAYNFGLIDVTDRPYREMLAGVKAANARLFDVHAGKLEPIPMQPLRAVKRSLREFLPESVGAVTFDSSNPQFHHNRLDRVRFGSNARFGVPLAVGTVDAGKPDGFAKLEFYVFLWKTEKNRNLSDWFQLEESADNVTFSPAPAVFRLHRDGPFREYVMTPQALKPGTRFVRLSFVLNDPAAPWATSLAEVKVERR